MTLSDRASAHAPTLSALVPDPAVSEFLELRLFVARVPIGEALSPERLEESRNTLREIARSANHAIRTADVRRSNDIFASSCFAARAQVSEARGRLAGATLDAAELGRARRALYRGLCLVAEGLAAASILRTRVSLNESVPLGPKHSVLFASFVTQIAAATRANARDIAWALEVADAEVSVAVAHPHFMRIAAEQRSMLRSIRGEIAAWASGDRTPDAGYALLNRLVLLVDCLNH
jgi:hypothetical protein